MSKIKVMSENLANKIAAGEVVEKCASIVKELVENSIDAHSDNIRIDLIDGGLKEIRVIDNGDGMTPDDALLAFQRHATSKLLKEDDLFFIDTLGFRGEALPSIASVSEVILATSMLEQGTLVHIKGGQIIENVPSSSRKGTSITIKNLFYNTPARLKYLKSEQYELSNITAFIERLALSYPNIKFTLTNHEKDIVKTSGSGNLLKTIHEIYGLSVSSKMMEIKASNNDYDIYGFACKPEILKSNRNHMITIVNGRVVKNNDLNRAINDAYYTYKPDSKYPLVVIKIETDPTLIDVNIHPTKQDIKLSKADGLYEMIIDAIKKQLYNTLLVPEVKPKIEYTTVALSSMINDPEEIKSDQTTFDFTLAQGISNNEYITNSDFDVDKIILNDDRVVEDILPITNEEFKSLKLYPVGLAHGTYIVAQNDDGIFLCDQHAVQERINYENYLNALKEKEISSIDLLFPLTVELSKSEFIEIQSSIEIFSNMGFVLEEFGVNTFVVKTHPIWLKEGYEEESVRKIIDLVITNKDKFDHVKFQEHIAITLACKMSIKANMNISMQAIEELLEELVKCDNPYNCPHGRPTIIKFTIYEIEKMFKRVM